MTLPYQHNKREPRVPAVTLLVATLAGLALSASPIRAVPIQTEDSSSTEMNFAGDVSTTDLLAGKTATFTGWNLASGSSVPELHDGIHGNTYAEAGNSVQGTWTTVGATATYNLGLGSNNLGYDITSIQTIAAWVNAAFGNQAYTVEIKLKGAANYAPLATVDYQPLATGSGGATKVILTDGGGVLASGVEFIRFTASSVNEGANSGAFVFREIDVFGTPTSGTDAIPPQISNLSPADNATETPTGTNLVATFNENIMLESGNITIKNLTDSTSTVVPVGDAQVSVSGAVLTINPASDLAAGKTYAVWIDAGAITDTSGNPFPGIVADTAWNFTSATTASAPLRIMCLGDSITAGYTDNPTWNHPFLFGYRSGLYTRLTNVGYNFKFVGASLEPWNALWGDPSHGGTYKPTPDLRDFGQDGHRGYGGKDIAWINSSVAGFLATDKPDVILLLIGINGMSSGSPSALNTLVNTIVTAAPNAHLIVAQITPRVTFNQDLYNYNVYIRDTLVPTYAGNGHKVTTVDLYSLFLTDPGNYASAIAPNVLSNNINHPDNPHYDLMAQAWFDAIEALGIAPNTFTHWINGFPGVGAFTGFSDDPDGDGIKNGLENLFGTDPDVASVGVVPQQADVNTFTFTHPQSPVPAEDIAGPFYRWSKNLTAFFADGASDGDGTTVNFSVQTNPPTLATVTATITGPATNKLFVTVGATKE